MTDMDLLAKKLALIETAVKELKTQGRPNRIADDIKEARFIEHTLQIAIQAAMDVASHIVSDERLGEPRTNREVFELLAKTGWISKNRVKVLKEMVGFRNILVHGYDVVDLKVVEDVVKHHLGDLLLFVRSIRIRLKR